MMSYDASFGRWLPMVFNSPCLVPTQVEHEEFQQESVLKQLEVLQEEDKEYQHIKVRKES